MYIIFILKQKSDRPAPKYRRQLITWQVCWPVERSFHNRELNHQPLPWELGVSPPSSCILRSSWTICKRYDPPNVESSAQEVVEHKELVKIDPGDSKSNRLHVRNTFPFCCFHSFEVYSSLDSSKTFGIIINLLKSPTSTSHFSNSTGSSATNRQFSPPRL